MKSTRDKIDEILGISSDMNVNDYLQSLADENCAAKKTLSAIQSTISSDLTYVEKTLSQTNSHNMQLTTINDLDTSMKKIENLIDLAEDMITHVHDCFCSSELVDSDLLHAASSFIESMHINIAEFISLYRDKQRFIEKVKLMAYAQEQKKELMQMKFDLDMKKLKEKDRAEAVDVNGNVTGGSFSFTVEDVTKALQNLERSGQTVEEALGIPEVRIPEDSQQSTEQQ